ncbi:MAG: DUF5062 family protein [Gammaproteobacteria bacterium]|nr:DUF5062 family protein [Gammaproteobacteria bacterium]
MKKIKNEKELLKRAVEVGMVYAEKRGAAKFESTDSFNDRALFIYRLLVRDGVIQPIPEDQVSQKTVGHKLAMWVAKQLPDDDPLVE